MEYPANFLSLSGIEDQITKESIEYLKSNDSLLHHLEAIHVAMQVLHYFSLERDHKDEDGLAITLLGIRIFNSSASAYKLSLAGYYQNATMNLRDILETLFLLDYFKLHPEKIAVWRTCSDKERERLFGPFLVREALDNRDEFTSQKRRDSYKLLCKLGTHPTPQGFVMLKRKGSDLYELGPFADFFSLEAIVSEQARLMIQAAGIYSIKFTALTVACLAMKVHFMEMSQSWFEMFYKIKPTPEQLTNLQTLRKELETEASRTQN